MVVGRLERGRDARQHTSLEHREARVGTERRAVEERTRRTRAQERLLGGEQPQQQLEARGRGLGCLVVHSRISDGLRAPSRRGAVEKCACGRCLQVDVLGGQAVDECTDARAVAACARLIEASTNPAFQPSFDNTVPGNIDPKALIVWTARKAGLPIKNFLITRATAQKNARERLMAEGGGMPPAQAAGAPPMPPAGQPAPGGPPPPPDPLGQPSAAILPPNPSAEPPMAQGATLAL